MTAAAEHDAKSILATWGEGVAYRPMNGQSRALTVVDESDSGGPGEVGRRLESRDVLSVFCLRDDSDETYGGIGDPKLGDTLTFSDEDHPDHGVPYSFSGRKSRVDRYSWTLEFTRAIPSEIGGHRR